VPADIVVTISRRATASASGRSAIPIKALVECGIGDDVVTASSTAPCALRDSASSPASISMRYAGGPGPGRARVGTSQEWTHLGRTAEQISPWSFPL